MAPSVGKLLLRLLANGAANSSRQVQLSARACAQLDLSDETAVAALKDRLEDVSPEVLNNEIRGWHARDTYVNDRACRLLIGIRDGAVPPIDIENRERFSREEALGRMPLPDAFAALAESEPRLLELERQLQTNGRTKAIQIARSLQKISEDSPSIGMHFELWLALRYLRMELEGSVDPRPFFEQAPLRNSHVTLGVVPGS